MRDIGIFGLVMVVILLLLSFFFVGEGLDVSIGVCYDRIYIERIK